MKVRQISQIKRNAQCLGSFLTIMIMTMTSPAEASYNSIGVSYFPWDNRECFERGDQVGTIAPTDLNINPPGISPSLCVNPSCNNWIETKSICWQRCKDIVFSNSAYNSQDFCCEFIASTLSTPIPYTSAEQVKLDECGCGAQENTSHPRNIYSGGCYHHDPPDTCRDQTSCKLYRNTGSTDYQYIEDLKTYAQTFSTKCKVSNIVSVNITVREEASTPFDADFCTDRGNDGTQNNCTVEYQSSSDYTYTIGNFQRTIEEIETAMVMPDSSVFSHAEFCKILNFPIEDGNVGLKSYSDISVSFFADKDEQIPCNNDFGAPCYAKNVTEPNMLIQVKGGNRHEHVFYMRLDFTNIYPFEDFSLFKKVLVMHPKQNCLNLFAFSQMTQELIQNQFTYLELLPMDDVTIQHEDVKKALTNWRRLDYTSGAPGRQGTTIDDFHSTCNLNSLSIDIHNDASTSGLLKSSNCPNTGINICSYVYDFSGFKQGQILETKIILNLIEIQGQTIMDQNSQNIQVELTDNILFSFGKLSHDIIPWSFQPSNTSLNGSEVILQVSDTINYERSSIFMLPDLLVEERPTCENLVDGFKNLRPLEHQSTCTNQFKIYQVAQFSNWFPNQFWKPWHPFRMSGDYVLNFLGRCNTTTGVFYKKKNRMEQYDVISYAVPDLEIQNSTLKCLCQEYEVLKYYLSTERERLVPDESIISFYDPPDTSNNATCQNTHGINLLTRSQDPTFNPPTFYLFAVNERLSEFNYRQNRQKVYNYVEYKLSYNRFEYPITSVYFDVFNFTYHQH